jgi:hypothetical protein
MAGEFSGSSIVYEFAVKKNTTKTGPPVYNPDSIDKRRLDSFNCGAGGGRRPLQGRVTP